MSRLIVLVYIVIGIFIALNRDYGADVDGVRGILSLVLAILLWPLVLLGVDLHLGRERRNRDGALVLGLAWPYLSAAVGLRLQTAQSRRRAGRSRSPI
jgi:hypothetical protein